MYFMRFCFIKRNKKQKQNMQYFIKSKKKYLLLQIQLSSNPGATPIARNWANNFSNLKMCLACSSNLK